jgi:hypothetical protein
MRTAGWERALESAQKYAGSLGIPWDDHGCQTSDHSGEWRGWWPRYRVDFYTFTILVPDAVVISSVRGESYSIHRFEVYPLFAKGVMLPLWLAYPEFNSVTIGWRMGSGEFYKYRWHYWYRSLSDEQRTEYKKKFPPPNDDDRAWAGFYEVIADERADPNSPGEYVAGRVP